MTNELPNLGYVILDLWSGQDHNNNNTKQPMAEDNKITQRKSGQKYGYNDVPIQANCVCQEKFGKVASVFSRRQWIFMWLLLLLVFFCHLLSGQLGRQIYTDDIK